MSDLFKNAKIFATNKGKRTIFLAQYGFYDCLNDEEFIKLQFRNVFGYEVDLDNPRTFNEKIQWLKLYNRKHEYTQMVDKYEVKCYISNLLGEQYIIPTLGVWNTFEEIDFNVLPEQFVLKCTHDSGGIVICADKNKFNYAAARRKINRCLKNNYYMQNREWPYKDVERRIIAEQYMTSGSGDNLEDYKFMCFNGKVKCIFTCSERFSSEGLKVTFYDTKWDIMPFERYYPAKKMAEKKPMSFDEMITLAEKISKDMPFVRVDFYEIDERPYFGEITFYPGSGLEKFNPDIWDMIIGEWIRLH